ncbi:MAG: tRNA pseudouridine(55) synthase TruB [Gammaproteobacteria bacterium]|nr:tRNA pseudouridine(55) synthase TruB [Gammaproteobacteria bacterium]
MSRRASARNVHGILLLDKPQGLTSNRALQRVRGLFQARKAGHTGSLDPLATGMLPICLGEATKVSGFLLDADKEYQVSIRLGQTTTTGDAEGETVSIRPLPDLSMTGLTQTLQRFVGGIDQIPPMYSALKRDGQPLYRLARQGIAVERAPRRVIIESVVLHRFDGQELALTVRCSKGTYIRSLAVDIGELLGCGAHVTVLRRSAVAGFDGASMVTLEQLEQQAASGGLDALDRWLLPMDSGLAHWPDIHLSAEGSFIVRRGQAVLAMASPVPGPGWVRLYGAEAGFLGLGQMLGDGRVAPKRLFNL